MQNTRSCETEGANGREMSERKKQLKESRRENRMYYGFGVQSAKALKVCKSCGAVCASDMISCTECGERLPDKNLYEMSVENADRCRHCKAILTGSENFCPICGKYLQAPE